MRRVLADRRDYYILSYASQNGMDGKFRTLTIKLRDSKLTVRGKRGYWETEQLCGHEPAFPAGSATPPWPAQALRRAFGPVRPFCGLAKKRTRTAIAIDALLSRSRGRPKKTSAARPSCSLVGDPPESRCTPQKVNSTALTQKAQSATLSGRCSKTEISDEASHALSLPRHCYL
jgi:hypothetical protein